MDKTELKMAEIQVGPKVSHGEQLRRLLIRQMKSFDIMERVRLSHRIERLMNRPSWVYEFKGGQLIRRRMR
jgi:hypothetical protein